MTDAVLPTIEMNEREAMEEFTRTLKKGELRDLFIKRTDEKNGNRIRVRELDWHSFTICEWYDKDNKVRASVTRCWEDHPLCPKYEKFVDYVGKKFGGWYLIDGKEYPYGDYDSIEIRWKSMMAGMVPRRPNESDPAWWKRKEQMDRENPHHLPRGYYMDKDGNVRDSQLLHIRNPANYKLDRMGIH